MNKHILLTASLGLSLTGTLYAAEPKPIQVGDYEARILVDASLEHSDNLFRSSSNEESSVIARVIPNISLSNRNASRDIDITYSAEAVKFFDFGDDDYISQNLGLDTLFKLSQLHSLGFSALYTDGNEQRGTGSSEGSNANITTGATEFSQIDIGTEYIYGSESNPLGVSVELSYSDIEFDNFRNTTRERDRDVTQIETNLSYKISAATSAFVDIRYSDFDYSSPTQSSIELPSGGTGQIELDNNQLVTHVGLAWSATKQTTGRVGIGQTSKDIDAAGDSSFGSWEALIEWRPDSSNTVNFEAIKDIQEPAGTGLFIETQRTGISWEREISPQWSFNLNASFTDSEFQSETRQDDTKVVGLEFLYRMTRHIDLSISYQNEDKDSNQNSFDFDSNVFLVSASIGL